MLRVLDRPLPPPAQSQLEQYQAEVDSQPTFAERVAAAKKRFAARNTRRNKTFQAVRRVLGELCAGPRRCMYCEDSVADEVEHFKPKDFYPDLAFVWRNYLYSCGPCNGGKNNRFHVILADGWTFHQLASATDAPSAPPAGSPALFDLRSEDPLDYLRLDLKDTFYFLPLSDDPDSVSYRRAEYTIEALGLNDRDYLPESRAGAFDSFVARLEQYVQRQAAGAPQPALDRLRKSLLRMGHPTVWAEIKRQKDHLPEVATLFERAPEALSW